MCSAATTPSSFRDAVDKADESDVFSWFRFFSWKAKLALMAADREAEKIVL
jgi:hypothetical protein